MRVSSRDLLATGKAMALQHLNEEQIRTWSREQKDRWWLENVFRGDMAQLTLRSALTGFLLGGLLSVTNLYVGAKTGWTLGVGLTSVILAFAIYRTFSRLGARDMTILENNCVQSIATAAGYMTMPLTSGLAAYMWATNHVLPWWQILCFNVVLSVLGVLVAFPMKRRFINDEQHPFPEGRACGVVLDALYERSAAAAGMFKAKVLTAAAILAGGVSFLAGENYMRLIQQRWLGWSSEWHLPTSLDAWYYSLVDKGLAPLPKLAGVDIRQLALSPTLDFAMIGAGGLMGIRTAASLLLGAILNFVVVVPVMISIGEIQPRAGSIAEGTALFGRAYLLNNWALWWGITMMVVAAMVTLFARPEVFVEAFRSLAGRAGTAGKGSDVLRHIELPLPVSWIGVPIVGAFGVWMAHMWFGVPWLLGAAAIPLILLLALIAASSTALTAITPSGSLSKIPQFTFGAIDPSSPAPNLMTAVMCSEVASNASNLLMDIKPGYMLGAKPRQQAIGHLIGIVAGTLVATPLFFVLFGLSRFDAATGASVMDTMVTDKFAFPAALQWKGVSDLVTAVFGGGGSTLLTNSIVWSMAIAGFASLVMELLRVRTGNRFPLSPLAIGLGVVVPPDSTLMMFVGAAFFWWAGRRYGGRPESGGYRLWIDAQEPICAGLIAGAALIGIGDILVKVFVFD
jgi:OPT family oligopeptide transporter